METKDKILLATAVTSILAFLVGSIFQFITYRIQKSKENENELFKMKLLIYSEILGMLNNIDNMLNTTQLIMDGNPEMKTSKEILDFADEFDNYIDSFDDLYIKNSLIIGDNASIIINKLIIHLYGKNKQIIKKDIKELKEYVNLNFEMSNELSEVMRDELGMDNLNIKLYKRIKR